jgi:hypothetical protein
VAVTFWTQAMQWTSLTEYRAWGARYAPAWAAAGLVQTADTGQINWATVSPSPTGGSASGYEIWRFNDAAQATVPMFMKIEYGAGAVSSPGIWVTVGTGSSGAGAITGINFARAPLIFQNLANAAAGDFWVSGVGDGWVALCTSGGATGGAAAATNFFCIERLRLADGTADTSADAGFVVCARNGASSSPFTAVLQDASVSEVVGVGGWPTLNPYSPPASSGAYKGQIYAYTYHPVLGRPRGAMKSAVCCFVNDLPSYAGFSIPVYGVTSTFRHTGTAPLTSFGRSPSPTVVPALRFD